MEVEGERGSNKTYFIFHIPVPQNRKMTKTRKNRRMARKNIG
jgi:hypothetical protein